VRIDNLKPFQIVLIVSFCLTGCDKNETIELTPIRVGETQAFVEIAATDEARQTGLMQRRSMNLNEGMLFIFSKPKILRFWTKNTPLTLDIGFFDERGVLLKYLTMEPEDERTIHQSPEPALYALEMNEGWFESNRIAVGSRLILPH